MKNKITSGHISETSHYDIGKPRKSSLQKVFSIFHLTDFREELEQWKNMALCAEQTVYYDCWERENLILFVKDLARLTEAFYQLTRKKQLKHLKKQTKKTLKIVTDHNHSMFLTKDEIKNPRLVIQLFTQTYKKSYARYELLDMLEAAVIYQGALPGYKGSLVLLYRQLDFLVRLAFRMKVSKTDDNEDVSKEQFLPEDGDIFASERS